jgi:ubiquinone/menaquinone biosynthesis C-methylase UbiE
MTIRSQQWLEIWQRKATQRTRSLHEINGYEVLDTLAWDQMITELSPLLGLSERARVVEFGCGAGAFLASLHSFIPTLDITGIDYAQPLIKIAEERVAGKYFVCDARNCPELASKHFDVACSFGITMYLDTLADVGMLLDEMRRTIHPAGRIFVGEVSNEALRGQAMALREVTHGHQEHVVITTPDHLYIDKAFFQDYAERHEMHARIYDHSSFAFAQTNPMATYRFSLTLEFKQR